MSTPLLTPKPYARWRAWTLFGVHVLFAAHIVHWKLAGRTLAPLELNELMVTLELGVVTAGFAFMLLVIVATLFFGRFFCSWGCHILALQDGSQWILDKLKIRPKPLRSRLLLWVPVGATLYMFLWPQLSRLVAGDPLPELRMHDDGKPWASFITDDFWRNLPPVGMALLTFFVVGFVVTLLLGSRSFCTYGCPYGALFRIADRFTPGRIKRVSDCSACGHCTAACSSGIEVHKELEAYGTVVSSSCLRDLDCIAACPSGAVGFGLAKPTIFRKLDKGRPRKPWTLSWPEELAAALIFLAGLFVFRGLYGRVPFLLSLSLGGLLAWFSIAIWRGLRAPHTAFGPWRLKMSGKWTRAGKLALPIALAVWAFVGHSSFVRVHERRADAAFELAMQSEIDGTERVVRARDAAARLDELRALSPLPPKNTDLRLGQLHLIAAAPGGAVPLARAVEQSPESAYLRLLLARAELQDGDEAAAVRQVNMALERGARPHATVDSATWIPALLAELHLECARDLWALERHRDALDHAQAAARLLPDDADMRCEVGSLMLAAGRIQDGIAELRAALAIDPDHALATERLAAALEN